MIYHVELDIFSGRPNPKWSLTAEETSDFNEHLQRLVRMPADKAPEAWTGLGYRGMIVRPEHDVDHPGRLIRLFSGVVVIQDGDRTVHYEDPGQQTALWLLERGRPHLSTEIYDQVEKALKQ